MNDQAPVKKKPVSWKAKMFRWSISLVIVYVAIVVGLVIAEPYLVYPALMSDDSQVAEEPLVPRGFVVCKPIETEDNVQLDTFHYCPTQTVEDARGVLLVCHGNGEWIGKMTDFLINLGNYNNVSVFCYDYRGFGQSKGFPNENGLLKDADAAYQTVIDLGYSPDKIIVYGRSIGGGPSCYIASRHKIGGLILHNTFSSLVDVAAKRFFWVPIRWIMRNRFDSETRLKEYKGPLLQTHGTADEVVPFHFGKKLFDSAGTEESQKEFHTEENGKHVGPISFDFRQKFKAFATQVLEPEDEDE